MNWAADAGAPHETKTKTKTKLTRKRAGIDDGRSKRAGGPSCARAACYQPNGLCLVRASIVVRGPAGSPGCLLCTASSPMCFVQVQQVCRWFFYSFLQKEKKKERKVKKGVRLGVTYATAIRSYIFLGLKFDFLFVGPTCFLFFAGPSLSLFSYSVARAWYFTIK